MGDIPRASRPKRAKKVGRKAMSKSRHRSPRNRDICFTIMPFGGWGDEYYETIYSPAIRAAGLEPHRADDLYRPSTIVNDIWTYTKKSKLLIADLSGKNPNVFYELGLAHALAKPVILVAESMEEIPFDLRALRIIVFNKNASDWGQLLREKIETSIKEVLRTPIEAVLPAFLELKHTSEKPAVTPHERELIEIKQELDLLRRELRGQSHQIEIFKEPPIDNIRDLRTMLSGYVDAGMPVQLILERVTRMGVPHRIVERELKEIRLTHKARRLILARPRRAQRQRE